MNVREVMSYGARVIDVRETVQHAAETMRASVVGLLPVVDDGELVGVITDRDIAVRSAARNQRPSKQLVRDVMTPEPVTCVPEDEVSEAAEQMIEHGLRRLIVVEREIVAGILSVDDLALVDETREMAVRVLHDLIARRGTEMDGMFAGAPAPTEI
jgi:CBS domain-containing protein